MLIKINNPKGKIPRITERQLPINYAQTAQNCDFTRGKWQALKDLSTELAAVSESGAIRTIFKINGKWAAWAADVDVIKVPVANDDSRIMFTGDKYPKQSIDDWLTTGNAPATTRRLGVIAPDGVAEIDFNSGSSEIATGDKIEGATSEATADVLVVSVTSGAWGTGDAAGTIKCRIIAGTWGAAENIDIVDGTSNAATTTAIDEKGSGLNITVLGTGDGRVANTVAYLYVGVTAWGEVSAISSVSAVADIEGGEYVRLSNFVQNSVADTGNDITHFLVYRATTGASGRRTYQLIKVRPDAATGTAVWQIGVSDFTTYLFDCNDNQDGLNYDVGDPINSLYWQPPPNNLSCLVLFQNGITAGLDGMQVYLSELNYYYAYASTNVLDLDYEGVALGVAGGTLIVATEAYPYAISGNDPQAVVKRRLNHLQPCEAKRSLISTPIGVFYAGEQGLVWCDGYQAKNTTSHLYTPTQWAALSPENLISFYWQGKYYGFFSGTKTGIIIAIGEDIPSVVDISLTNTVYGGHVSPEDNALYLLTYDGSDYLIEKWEGATTSMTLTWKSGKMLTIPTNLACAQIIGATFGAGDSITFKWYADGALKATQTVEDNDPFWLPSGFLAETWEAQVETDLDFDYILIAHSPGELTVNG